MNRTASPAILTAARQFVKQQLLTGLEPPHGRYRYTHTLRVAEIGRRIARAEGLDEEMLVLACLLHDVGYVRCKTDADYIDHGLLSAQMAAEFLEQQGYDDAKAESVCYGIRIHTLEEEKHPRPATALENTVGDADNIDRFDAYRLYEGLARARIDTLPCAELQRLAERRAEQMRRLVDWPFATPTAARLWKEKLAQNEAYYNDLRAQMDVTLAWDPQPETL